MASAVVFWNYQRRLSTGGSQTQGERRESVEITAQRTKRTESEGSVTSYHNDDAEDRRGSVGDSTDEEALEHGTKSKASRRFSLDFLFSRRKSKDKGHGKTQKSKRSQSTTEASETLPEEGNLNRSSRYPSGAEFALAM